MTEPLKIKTRSLVDPDLSDVANVHMAAFPHTALSALGHEAIRRYYASAIRDHPEAFSLCCLHENRLIGFCVGGVFRGTGVLGEYLRQHRWFLMTLVLLRPWLIISNALFRNRLHLALRTLQRGKNPPATSPEPGVQKSPAFRILAIAIHPESQRHGIGGILMAESEKIACSRGFDTLGLTVHLDNTQAIRFYERLGWERFNISPAWAGEMIKAIPRN